MSEGGEEWDSSLPWDGAGDKTRLCQGGAERATRTKGTPKLQKDTYRTVGQSLDNFRWSTGSDRCSGSSHVEGSGGTSAKGGDKECGCQCWCIITRGKSAGTRWGALGEGRRLTHAQGERGRVIWQCPASDCVAPSGGQGSSTPVGHTGPVQLDVQCRRTLHTLPNQISICNCT